MLVRAISDIIALEASYVGTPISDIIALQVCYDGTPLYLIALMFKSVMLVGAISDLIAVQVCYVNTGRI
jgi:hypothetical protein